MTTILLLAIVCGPLPEASPTLTLRLHLGIDQRSKIARAELSREDLFWTWRLEKIRQNYRLIVDDDAFDNPTWQIGHGDRQVFRPGSFAASGTFIQALESIAEIDNWERRNQVHLRGWADAPEMSAWDIERLQKHLQARPVAFPAEPEESCE